MLKSIRIKNFQAHKDSFIEFSEGVTAIYGTTDHGKSSIIRALQIFFTQRPKGSRYIRRKQKGDCEIQVVTNKEDITFIRNSTTGKYVVGDDELQALQGNVPVEVENLLNIEEINISKQFEPLYLIHDTPGKAATRINSVTHLEKADDLIKNLSTDLRDTNSKIKVYTNDSVKWTEELKNYENLPKFEKWLNKALDIENRCLVLKQRESALEGHCEAIKSLVTVIETIVVSNLDEIENKIIVLVEKQEKTLASITKLESLITNINNTNGSLGKIGNIEKLVNIEKIDDLIANYQKVEKDLDNLEKYTLFFKTTKEQIDKYDCIIKEVDKEICNLLSQLDICEQCGQELTEEAKEYMVNK